MSWDEVTLSSEEIKPVALSIVELCLAEGMSQLVSWQKIQLNRNLLRFHNNWLEGFKVNLKTFLHFLGLVMPNQYCQIVA